MKCDKGGCACCRGDESEDAAQRLFGAFLRIARLQRRRRAADGVSGHEHHLLHVLRRLSCENPAGPRVSELSECLGVTPPTVTQQITELERKGLVRRIRDDADRRTVRLLLSPAGEALLERGRTESLGAFASVAVHLGEARAEELAALLSEAADFLEASDCGNC